MPNMEDIRRIAKQNQTAERTQAVLADPLCVLLLGTEATKHAEELRSRLTYCCSNADSHLTVATICFGSDMPIGDGKGNYVIDPKPEDPQSREYIKLQLGKVVQLIEADQRRRAPALMKVRVRIVTSSRDAEASWAGLLMMLLNTQYHIGQSSVGDAQLFCLISSGALMLRGDCQEMDTFGSLLTDKWQDASQIDEPMRVFSNPFKPKEHVVAKINTFYVSGTPIFNHTFLMGTMNNLGWAIRESDRLDMLASFMDPNSGIDWSSSNSVSGRFFSGFIYPDELELGADLALVWYICQERFYDEYGTRAPESSLNDFNRTHRPIMQQAYVSAQQEVNTKLPHRYVNLQGSMTVRSKYDYLWLGQARDMQEKVEEWKAAYEKGLCQVWNLNWLSENESNMLMEYNDRDDIATVGMHSDARYGIARFNGKDNMGKIRAHIEKLNDWAQSRITQRKVFLNEMQTSTMNALNADAQNVYDELRIALEYMGLNGDSILQARKQELLAFTQINTIYRQYVDHMSLVNGRDHLETFLRDTADILFSPEVMLMPHKISMPQTACYAFQSAPTMADVQGSMGTIQAGLSKGMHYYICTVNGSSIQGL